MTEIEQTIEECIKKYGNKVKLFWDMDGTCASMEMREVGKKMEPGFYCKKRPIMTILQIMKKFSDAGAQTYILSLCSFYYQLDDKMKWINRYCNFIHTDNIIIIPHREDEVKVSGLKCTIKAEYMQKFINHDDVVFMIDDNEDILLCCKDIIPSINIVSPIDFIE